MKDSEPFLWGASTSAFQVEGTSNAYGRGLTIWDTFINETPSPIKNDSNADIACNSYLQYKDDIKALKMMNANSYRFSISWSRIYPNGTGNINLQGVYHYNSVINECLANNITPVVCLYHWDLPQALQDKYNGWLCTNGEIWADFSNYASTCFSLFGDKVKHWATINEPQTIAVDCYEYDWYAPASGSPTGNSPNGDEYKVAHNLLISHAYAVNIYRTKYRDQKGKIGIICNMDWGEPYTNSAENIAAAERRNVFWGGWFWDPIMFGNYPQIMIDLVGDRLPKFTKSQSNLLQGSIDMIMLNSYSAEYIYSENYSSANLVGWNYDQQTAQSYYTPDGVIIGEPSQSGWLHLVPWGINKVLSWIQNRYSFNGCGTGIGIMKNGKKVNIPLMITEQGIDLLGQDQTTTYEQAKNDSQRIQYYSSYLDNIGQAVKSSGIDFIGYFPWALLDNFEWSNAYTCRFGLFYLNCNTPGVIQRLPKDSVFWYKNYIDNHPKGPFASYNNNKCCKIYHLNKEENTPWSGGPIRGYYYFSENFYNSTYPTANSFYSVNNLTVPQNKINKTHSNFTFFVENTLPIQYTDNPSNIQNSNFNAFFLFTQYANFNDIMNNGNIENLYNNSISYFTSKNINNGLIGISFGGGTSEGTFTLGQDGSIASIYTAITPLNNELTYNQSNGDSITITGTGAYSYSDLAIAGNLGVPLTFGQYNCILFDIELATVNDPENNVLTSDFTNLFKYIKTVYPSMLIIVAISHSCSNSIPNICSDPVFLECPYIDYFAPIMYTQYFGTSNEYTANFNQSWQSLIEKIQENPNFKKYGLNFFLPSIYTGYPFTVNGELILDLYMNGGSNTNYSPNLYYYQSSDSVSSTVVESWASSNISQTSLYFFQKDTGIVDFFNNLGNSCIINTEIKNSPTLGGFIQWSNYYSS